MRAEALAQRLLDLRAKLRRMFGEPADFLEHLQALRPESFFFERVAEETEERVGLRALLGFAQRLGERDEGTDVARVALDLVHPERLEVIEFFLLNQSIRVVAERHGDGIL